ncbi:ribonuclease H-like domain-containing protein [Tanacetum coccineum]
MASTAMRHLSHSLSHQYLIPLQTVLSLLDFLPHGYSSDVSWKNMHFFSSYGHLIKDTSYMHQPPGFTDSAHSDCVCLLQNKTDSSLFIFHKGPVQHTYYLRGDIIRTASLLHTPAYVSSLYYLRSLLIDQDLGPLTIFLEYMCHCVTTYGNIYLVSRQICYRDILEASKQMLNCNPLQDPIDTKKKLWSKRNPPDTLSRSSAEAEYRGVANAVAETSWIRNLLRELHTPLFTATLVYCDKLSVL